MAKTHPLPKEEISIWHKTGNFYFGLTQAGVPMEEADFVILNYEILRKNLDVLLSIRARAVVCDEAHYIKHGKSQRTQATANLIRYSRPDLVLMLTGTPIMNRPVELVQPLKMLGLLDTKFGGWRNFVERYCNAWRDKYGWHLDGASNLEELNRNLRKYCMVRREKAEVLRDLPDKIRTVLELPLASDCGYKHERKQFMEWLDGKLVERGIKVDKKANLPGKVVALMKSGHGNTLLTRMSVLRQATGIGKIPAIISWIKDFQETEQPLVVFAHHRAVQEALANAFPEAGTITGGMSAEARQRAVDDFQNGKTKLIICSQQSAQTGITLTAASNVLICELDWTPAALEQAEDRCHRIGQKDSVTIYRAISADGFDPEMLEIIQRKEGIIQSAISNPPVETEGESMSGSVVDRKRKRQTDSAEIKPETKPKRRGRPPLSEAERRRRQLEAKRRWARRNRARKTEYMREWRKTKRADQASL